jgi:two-component system cell cycle sensor histidine kinase/response regulator CckA
MFFKKKTESEETPIPPNPAGRPWKILCVDDDLEFRTVVRQMLESQGYEVITASTGVKGLELFARDKDTIDLVLLDISMPTLDGEKTFDWLKKLKPNVKAIVISGTEELYLKQIQARHGIPYIHKPFKIDDAIHQINDMIRSIAEAAPSK